MGRRGGKEKHTGEEWWECREYETRKKLRKHRGERGGDRGEKSRREERRDMKR